MNERNDGRSKKGDTSTPRYWYASASFVAAVVISTAIVALLISLGGRSVLRGGVIVVWLGGLVILGIITYPALLKETAKVREMGFTWQPKSWYYVLLGFSAPFVTLIVLGQRYPPAARQLLSIIAFILASLLLNSFYLYRRHRFLGTP